MKSGTRNVKDCLVWIFLSWGRGLGWYGRNGLVGNILNVEIEENWGKVLEKQKKLEKFGKNSGKVLEKQKKVGKINQIKN
jgi:hypothetical protein